METLQNLPVAIIGAGPVGLAAAAHLTLRNQPFILFEAGKTVASNVLTWKHVRIFSPWKYNIDKAARELLSAHGWVSPEEGLLPTGEEIYSKYLKPLSETVHIKPFLHLDSRVVSVGRKNLDKMKTSGREALPFVIQVLHDEKLIKQYEAKAIIDTSGTWSNPNPIGSGGTYAAGEIENGDKIFYGIPDVMGRYAERYKNKNVLVVGSGHTSIQAILELDKLKNKYPNTEIHWVLRKDLNRVYGGKDQDALAARGALGVQIENLVLEEKVNVYTPFQIQQILSRNNKLAVIGYQLDEQKMLPPMDEIISGTGSRPDFSFLREVRLSIDPGLESVLEIAELIDPNIHSCGTVRPHGEKELRHPDKDFYIAGSKSYGRAPTFLMATGYEQVRSIVAAISGDMEGAQKVELELPETGVCSTDFENNSCCGATRSKQRVNKKNDARQVSCCS
ncbi:NAD(P)-binding domain-containing protein [Chryseolinea sp. H1M3-3]|uniref:NAD(P)-binding domain-containing protein n=1 Tax=Chryseolinea sp. H1M3-3 TaxID=3034144 RepID=UPI0023EC6255|nr:NAD(P)-binding domain-containing protein [Chryseolinea sp. H1M3-3]